MTNTEHIEHTIYTVYNGHTQGGQSMATKSINFKLDEKRIADMKQVASVFHMTMTDIVNDALDAYLPKMQRDPFYRLTANVQDASQAETEEILSEISELSDDDLSISSVEHFSV